MLALANQWQRGFPLAPRPFLEIGRAADLGEETVLESFRQLKREGVIDRVGPVFRPNAVGASSLAAMSVPRERLQAVADIVSAQPGVNHNYERNHPWNLWFVATGASDADVQRTLSAIERAAGLPVLRLPLLEEFHIDLGFDLDTNAAPRAGVQGNAFPGLEEADKALVRHTVRGLPLVPQPYAEVAERIGRSAAQVIADLGRMLADGRIRRIGAVIRHRRLGYEANAMVVWDVPDREVSAIAPALARDPAVTLCYRRARAEPHWPYNLYCMVHGRDGDRVRAEIAHMAAAYGLQRFPSAVLFGERCFTQRAAAYG